MARAAFGKDKTRLAALGLTGAMPKTTLGFITAAYAKVEEKMDSVGDEPSELFDEFVENDEQESSPIS